MKKISYNDLNVLNRKVQEYLINLQEEKGFDIRPTVTVDYDVFNPDEEKRNKIFSKVGWASIGTVSADDALEWSEMMIKASILAFNINYEGFTVDASIKGVTKDWDIAFKKILKLKA